MVEPVIVERPKRNVSHVVVHLIRLSATPPARPLCPILWVAKPSVICPRHTRHKKSYICTGGSCGIPAVRQHGGGDASGRCVPGGHLANGWPDVQKDQEQMGLEQEGAGDYRRGEERPVAE